MAAARKYEELWRIGLRRVELDPEVLAAALAIAAPVHVAVLNEDWCIDAVSTVPYIVRLAAEAGTMDVRIFGRDANPDLMDAHLTNGTRSIPLAIFYDRDFVELGSWGPRPAPLQEWALAVGATLPVRDRYQYIRQWYARDRGRTTGHEVAALLRALAGSGADAG